MRIAPCYRTDLFNVSKHLLSVGLVCAVTAAGWSSVLAAGLCPHAGCAAEAVAAKRSAPHCETSSSEDGHSAASDPRDHAGHEEAADDKQAGEDGEADDAGRARAGSIQGALGRHDAPCAHCVGSPQTPAKDSPKVARSEARRDADADAPRAARREVLTAAASFPALAPSQGSPPAPAARRKHLVLGTFLI